MGRLCGERVAGVAEVVENKPLGDLDARLSGLAGDPEPGVVPRTVVERPAASLPNEQHGTGISGDVVVDVLGELIGDRIGDHDGTNAGVGLGCADVHGGLGFTFRLVEKPLALDLELTGLGVPVGTDETEELTDTDAAEAPQQDQAPVQVAGALRQLVDFGDADHQSLSAVPLPAT